VDKEELRQFNVTEEQQQSNVTEEYEHVSPAPEEPESEEFTAGIHWCGPTGVKKDK